MLGEPNPSKSLDYAVAFLKNVAENEFNIQTAIAVVALFSFVRILINLFVTELLGPILSTTLYMFKDVATFILIWFLVLMAYTMSSFICFNDNENFRNFGDVFLYWL